MPPLRSIFFRTIRAFALIVPCLWAGSTIAQPGVPTGTGAAATPVPGSTAAADPACPRYRAELASLSDSVNVSRALQGEIGRLEAYHRSLNCEGGRFLFFDSRPPQCGAVEQRIRALNATYGSSVGTEDNSSRRRHLQAFIAANCPLGTRADGTKRDTYASGGAQVICVRTCDGGYFPMRNLPEGRGGADEMCQALCPGTEAAAYSMPYGDDALRHAAAVKGNRSYASLSNAFKYQKAFVPNCSCKPANQTWAQSLGRAESMLVRHKGDIFVTPMQAEALSRPKVRLTLVGRADKTAAELAADAAGRAASATGSVPALGSTESVPKPERTGVRIIAPDLFAAPKRDAP